MNHSALKLALMVDANSSEIEAGRSSLVSGTIWYDTFSDVRSNWLSRTVENWKIFSDLLPNFYAALQSFLTDVALINFEEQECVAYCFSIDGSSYLYIGILPAQKYDEAKFNLPEKFSQFYSKLHNGFYFQPAISLGPLPLENIFCIGDEEWGWMEDEVVNVDPNEYLAVFSNGGGGYICLPRNSENRDELNMQSLIWWDDGPPDSENFWPLLDAWMYSGLVEND